MAGRLLPIALAAVSGVAIGIATFDGEFKERRRQRLEDDYKRDIAAVSSLNREGRSPMASSAVNHPPQEQFPKEPEAANNSKLSSILGFWAWKKQYNSTEEASAMHTNEGSTKQSQQQQR